MVRETEARQHVVLSGLNSSVDGDKHADQECVVFVHFS